MAHLATDDDARGEAGLERSPLSMRQLATRILPYLRRFRRDLFHVGLQLLLIVGLNVFAPLLLGQLVDLARQAGGADVDPWGVIPASDGRTGVLQVAGVFIAVVALTFLLEARVGLRMARVGVAVVMQLKEDLFRKLLTLDPDFFRDYTPGRLIARVESDTQSLKNLFSTTSLMLVRAVLTLLGIAAVMLAREPRATAIVVPLLLLLVVTSVAFTRFVRRYFGRSRRYLARMTSFITEQLQGMQVLQHYGHTGAVHARLAELGRDRQRVDTQAAFLNYGFLGFFAACEVGVAALLVSICAAKVLAGALTLGTLVAFLDYLRRIFQPIQMLSEHVAHLQQAAVSGGRVFAILATERRHGETADAAQGVSFQRDITLEGVRFSYDGQEEVLRDINLVVPRGTRVALVGPSGGGKSTLVKLLLRFHEPTAGRILVDGVDLQAVSRAAWRAQLGLVPQEVYLFPGSLADNLAVFDERFGETELLHAATVAGALELIERFPGGLAGEIGERGSNLSQGERQLLSLVRALLHDPAILILDEATSAIDPATERRIQRSIEAVLAGRTAFIVAHRLSTVRTCHQIVVIDGGRIVERGTHEQLMSQPDGLYRELVALQFAEAAEDAQLGRSRSAGSPPGSAR